MAKNGHLQIVAAGMLLACSSFSLRAQELPATAPTGAVSVEGGDAPAVIVAKPARPTNPPHVSCAGDQLSIEADNSMLSSVLDAVHSCIGVKIALPEGAVDGPVFFKLGPGPTREVLDSLLSETDLDFVILLSTAAPEKVVTVELVARTPDLKSANALGAAGSGTMSPARLAWLAARNIGRGAPPPEEPTVELLPKAIGGGGRGSVDHAEAGSAEGTASQPEKRPVTAGSDAGAPNGTAASDPSASVNAAASTAGTSINAATSSASTATNATSSDAGASTNAAASDSAAAGNRDAVTTAGDTPSAASTTDPAAVPAEQELQHKITDMQQLFEQRKKLNATPATTPDSTTAPAPNPS